MTDYVICPTTGKKLDPNTLIPIDDYTSFKEITTQGDLRVQCEGFDGPCDSLKAKRRHKGTAYIDDELNYVTICDSCYEKEREYWDDMWREYYAGCM